MQISLIVEDPDTLISDLRSVARAQGSPVSRRLLTLAGKMEAEVNAWREALHRAATMVPKVEPHSRACGISRHEHGVDCHANCPTCHGERMWLIDPSPELPELPLIEAPSPEEFAKIVDGGPE